MFPKLSTVRLGLLTYWSDLGEFEWMCQKPRLLMLPISMMTSSNGNIFRVTGPLRGEFTGTRWIPRTKASDAELWWVFYLCLNKRWVNNGEAGDLRRYLAHYEVTVMLRPQITRNHVIYYVRFAFLWSLVVSHNQGPQKYKAYKVNFQKRFYLHSKSWIRLVSPIRTYGSISWDTLS